ncbi:carbohydrate esterase family 4 protein [Chlamydoabsidia padenii]|nr:carbohydrate esterase family 4 protein [Chlamydoabsidia padenii]
MFMVQALPIVDEISVSKAATGPKIRTGLLTKCQNPKHFALTFDDGPYEYTSALIDLLNAQGVKATFFINGNNYWSGSQINAPLKKAYKAGHEIASHTFTHPSIPSLTTAQLKKEMYNNEQAIYKAIKKYPAVMRPPFGDVTDANIKQLNGLGYTVVSWSLDVNDWNGNPTLAKEMKIVNDGLKDPANHNVILEHDVYQQTTTKLAPAVIKAVKAKGLTLVTVSECLGVDAYKSTGIKL